MLKGELQYTDKRSRKMVYMSRCILNCNAKFPGCADVPGVYTEIIHPIAKAGIGIEQMPCLEIMGWGGVDRPLVMHELDPKNPNADWVQEYPDSPTCGLTNTQVFPDVHFQIMEMDIPEDKIFDFEYTFNVVLPQLHASGEGAFGYQLYLEVERRNLGIPFVPFGPTKPRDEEVKRILDDLSLTL
jgi:hypothetical protein